MLCGACRPCSQYTSHTLIDTGQQFGGEARSARARFSEMMIILLLRGSILISSLTGMSTTTIKVPRELRDRVQKHAARQGVTQATVLSEALDLLDRRAFFDRLRADVEAAPETLTEAQERDSWLGGALTGGHE